MPAEVAQLNQLRRGYTYQFKREVETGTPVDLDPKKLGLAVAAGAGVIAAGPLIQRALTGASWMPSGVKFVAVHPAGPFTSQGLAPSFKWMLSISNLKDYDRPTDKMSLAQQSALCATGFVWSRYSMVIVPKNWNLFAVNVALACTGTYQLGRCARARRVTRRALTLPPTQEDKGGLFRQELRRDADVSIV